MSATKLRPTFVLKMPVNVDDAMNDIRSHLESGVSYGRVKSAGRCLEFYVEENDKRLWSPYLSVQAHQEGPTTVFFGRYSPRPEIWTFLMFLYLTSAFLILFGLILAYVQWTLESPPSALVGCAIGLLFILTIHIASVIGQRKSSDQMHRLRGSLDLLLARSNGESPTSSTE